MLNGMGRQPRAADVDLLEAIYKLRTFQTLGDNWDGSGALPFDASTLNNAGAILTVLADWVSVPAIYPESNGTVTFDWAAGEYQSLVEVGRTRFSAFIRRGPEALYLDHGLVAACFPGSFIRMAQIMQNYPVGERLSGPDLVMGCALAWTDDVPSTPSLYPNQAGQASSEMPAFWDWLATVVHHMAPASLAR